MWEYTVKLPSRWLTRDQVLNHLGCSEERFKLLLAKGLLRTVGQGTGKRYDGEGVYAIGVLLQQLDPLLSDELPPEPE